MSYKMYMLLYVAALILCCVGILLLPSYLADEPTFYYSPDQEESYTVGDFDQLQIRRVYRLALADDPAHIPTTDFEWNGCNYHMLEMDKDVSGDQIVYTLLFNGTKIR